MGSVVAIIPARAGSTRIPRKNVRDFAGKPMLCYSIEAAKATGVFNHIVVSTDSDEIADVARAAAAEVPFKRPSVLSENTVSVVDVVTHAVRHFVDKGETPEYVCCLVATAPFLRPASILEGYRLIRENDVDSVVSVTAFPFPILRAFRQDEKGRMRFIWPEHEMTHSNQLPPAYHDAAQFYWVNGARFLQSKSLLGREVLPVVIPRYLVVDIDTPDDWEAAEVAYQTCRARGLL